MHEQASIKPYFPNEAAKALLEYAQKQFDEGGKVHIINGEKDVNKLIDPLGSYPHAFVLACIMDRQVPAEKAWRIPKLVKEAINSFDMKDLLLVSEDEYKKIFREMPKDQKHRHPEDMASFFYKAVQRIHDVYNDDASEIWKGNLPSGILVSRFLQFDGVGVKIATMATNILVRQFGICVADKHCIDISPDTHVVHVFQRLHLIQGDSTTETIYMAREINPEYPGILDYPCFDVGKNYCSSRSPKCKGKKGQGACPFFDFCPSRIEK